MSSSQFGWRPNAIEPQGNCFYCIIFGHSFENNWESVLPKLVFCSFISFWEGTKRDEEGKLHGFEHLKSLGKMRMKFRGRKDLGDITVKNKALGKISEIVRGF
jgi:hypothetical protein